MPSDVSSLVDQVIAPGDEVLDLNAGEKFVRLGSGLRQDGDVVVSMRAGRLRRTKKSHYWLETSQKRYLPAGDDVVVGVVTNRHSETFDVDIRGPCDASLPIMSFEGATRRNLPRLQVGSAVYARVLSQHPDKPAELACVDGAGKSSGFGPLIGGYIFQCTTGLSRMLLSRPACPVLAALGAQISFELAVGMNGQVWVNAESADKIVLVSNAILNSEFLSPSQQKLMVKKLLENAK